MRPQSDGFFINVQKADLEHMFFTVHKRTIFADVKRWIEQEADVPVSLQHLTYDGVECLDDERVQCLVMPEEWLELHMEGEEVGTVEKEVKIKGWSGSVSIDVGAFDKIIDLKRKIEAKTGLNAGVQHLFAVCDESQLGADYELQNDHWVYEHDIIDEEKEIFVEMEERPVKDRAAAPRHASTAPP